MKKFLFLICGILLLFTSASFAEVKKGDWLISGSTSLGSYNAKEKFDNNGGTQKYSSMGLRLTASKMLTDKISLGPIVSYNKYKLTPITGGGNTEKDLFYGLNAGYYFQPEGKINPYISVMLGRYDFDYGPNLEGDAFGYGASLGSLFFVTENIGISLEYSYGRAKMDYNPVKATFTEKIFSVGFGFKI